MYSLPIESNGIGPDWWWHKQYHVASNSPEGILSVEVCNVIAITYLSIPPGNTLAPITLQLLHKLWADSKCIHIILFVRQDKLYACIREMCDLLGLLANQLKVALKVISYFNNQHGITHTSSENHWFPMTRWHWVIERVNTVSSTNTITLLHILCCENLLYLPHIS